MTAPNLTSPNLTSPNLTSIERLEITDPKIAALFIKDHVSSYLAQFIGAEITLKKAALQIGAKLNVLAYWAARFVKLGLIRVTRIETRGGSAIKHYRAVANEFIVPIALLEGFSTTEILQNTMRRDYERFSRSVSAAGTRLTPDWHIRLYRNEWGHGTPLEPSTRPASAAPRPLHDFAYVTMPAAQAAAFHQELATLLERFRDGVQHEPGLPRFLMHVGFAEDAG
jgi:hypothetical protein